jgi:DHA2 family methylenomycin A resistance protein-like MFS transporter
MDGYFLEYMKGASVRERPASSQGKVDRPPDRTGRAAALVAICLGSFVIQLDATIVNVALPSIGRSVGGSVSVLQWVVDSYTLVLAAGMLTAGSLAARRVFLLGLIGFVIGSSICAVAPNLGVLIAV